MLRPLSELAVLLDALPGEKRVYLSGRSLREGLGAILSCSRAVAMQYSRENEVPYVSRVDAGTVELVRALGPEVVTSADLVQEFDATLTPAQLVDRCLDLMGPLAADDETRAALVAFAATEGDLHLKEHQPGDASEQRVGNLLRLIASTREFQLA